ncbi:MAG TPA: peptidoglycan-binding domain-containing protein, partial [Nakamurella sp.]
MPHNARVVHQRDERATAKVARGRSLAGSPGFAVLALQRAAGNRAVAGIFLQRCGPQQPDCGCSDEEKAAAEPQVQRLTVVEREQDLVSPRLAGDPRLQAAFDNAPAMRSGERGEAVRLVQESLVADGQVMPRSTTTTGALDGIFGAETHGAVRDFQTAHAAEGLGIADGVVGRRTLGKFDEQGGGPSPKPPDLPPCPPPLQQDEASDGASRVALSPLTDGPAIPNQTCDPDRPVPKGTACVKSKAVPANRSGIIRPSLGTVGESFEMNVEWSDTPLFNRRPRTSFCAAECGEYHQFVKGHQRTSSNKDGSDLKDVGGTMFGGEKLDENTFREDGLDGKPKARYGHRQEPTTMNEKYEPDRATGNKYFGKDFPNISIGTFA